MEKLLTKQIEEYRHRNRNEIFQLNKVNAEILYYLTKQGALEIAFKGINNFKDKLFRCLGLNDYNKRLYYGKNLMKELWESELGLGPYPFAEMLSEFQFGGQFWNGYRDHVLHQIKVYLLGLYLFFGCKRIRQLFNKTHEVSDFLIQWKIAALSHDHGYLFEAKGAEKNQWVIDKVMPVFDSILGYPLCSISTFIRDNKDLSVDDELKKKVFSSVRKRSITRGREEQIQSLFDIVRPNVRTAKDISKFKEIDLFGYLQDIGEKVRLAQDNSNSLKSYYDFAYQNAPSEKNGSFRDHGITSALFLLFQFNFNKYYYKTLNTAKPSEWRKVNLPSENTEYINSIIEISSQYEKHIIEAAKAVAIHNISPSIWDHSSENSYIWERDFGLTIQDFQITPDVNPLAFLLVLVDTLQDWDRPCFTDLSEKDLPKFQADQDLSITLDNDKIYLSFPNESSLKYDPFIELNKELTSKIDTDFINKILEKKAWNGIGICHLTKEAQEIESSCGIPANFVSSEKLKELISSSKKSEIFEYTAYLNTNRKEHLLTLLKHLSALANTKGGYFVIGIDEKGCVPHGIDRRTEIHDHDSLNDFISLFCSSSIDYFSGKKKILMNIDGVNTYRTFFVFYVPKNNNIVYFIRDSNVDGLETSIINKYEIYMRADSVSKNVSEELLYKIYCDTTSTIIKESLKDRWAYLNAKIPDGTEIQSIPGKLPTPDFESLFGRDQEKNEIYNFFSNRKVFSWTIDGIGGSGKSTLALDIARNIKMQTSAISSYKHKDNFKFDGIVWVSAKSCELDPESGIIPKFDTTITLEILLDEISDTIGWPDLKMVDLDEKIENILEYLEDTCLLIVIDNLETIPEGHQTELIDFIDNRIPPPSKIIYTTRTKFHRGHYSRIMELEHEDSLLLAKDIALSHNNFEILNDQELLNNIIGRTGGIPLGIKWLISRVCLGHSVAGSFEKLLDDKTLIRFCFEDTLKCLKENDEITLYAIALCDFIPTVENIEFITEFPNKIITESIERLVSFSLVKMHEGNLSLLPLTKDYALYQLNKNNTLAIRLKKNLEKVYQGDGYVFSNSIPANQIETMRLYKDAAREESKGNLDMACNKLEAAVTISEDDYVIKALAEVYDRLNRIPDAKDTYINYLNRFGEDFEVLKKLGKYAVDERDYDSSLKYLERALALNKEDKDLWYHRGRRELTFAYEYGQNSIQGVKFSRAAIKSFQNAIRNETKSNIDIHKNSQAYLNIARSYFFLFDPKTAYKFCAKAIELDSENKSIQAFLKKIQEYI